ncbi:MAG TPA: glycosyltransferase family 9 protein [Candidatus Methylomirabilis sp.]|nr:glycosyltransferase family 9 protein [Candidatus Methylomirabilis sp.]
MTEAPSFLVIRRDNIGDLVCTTPLIRALRERFPQARVCVLVNSYNRPVVENNPDIDTVYAYTKAKHREKGESVFGVYWNRLRLMLELRGRHFDYAIIAGAHFLPRGLRLARWIRPKHIVGFTEPGKRGVERIDMGVPYTLPRPLHEAEDVFRLLAPLGIEGEPPPMRVFPAAAALAQANAALRDRGLPPDNVIGVHISARKPTNRWPAERFAALIRCLREQHRAPFMLFWSPGSESNPRHPGDDEKAQSIMGQLGDVPILAYPTDRLDQLIAGLSVCRAVLCSDGGAMHIAAALGKPILCFFGKSDKSRWYPWKAPHVLLQPASQNVGDITVDEAARAFEQLTAQGRTDAVGVKQN